MHTTLRHGARCFTHLVTLSTITPPLREMELLLCPLYRGGKERHKRVKSLAPYSSPHTLGAGLGSRSLGGDREVRGLQAQEMGDRRWDRGQETVRRLAEGKKK